MSLWLIPILSIGLVVWLAAVANLRRALWLTRVPLGFGIAAFVALALPEQTRYLVAGIETPWQAAALLGAVWLTGIGTWFWARWSLNLAWQAGLPGGAELRADGFWWAAVPRVLAVMPGLAMGLCLWFARGLMPPILGIALAILLAAVTASLVWIAWARRGRIRRRRGVRREQRSRVIGWFLADEALPDPPRPRPRDWLGWMNLALACLPFRWWVLLPLVLTDAVLVGATLAGARWPDILAEGVGAAPAALGGMAAILTLLAPLVGVLAAACRWPALLFLALLVVGAAGANVNTEVRRGPQLAAPRPTLDEAAGAWLEARLACPGAEEAPLRAMIVAHSGGASRAALWAAGVMRALELHESGPRIRPGRDLFAISGISGGALGAAAYVATLPQAEGCAPPGLDDPAARHARLQAGLSRDFLAPALQGLLFGDAFWRLAGPVSALAARFGFIAPDRTIHLERAWERAFGPEGDSPMQAMLAGRSLAPGAAPRLPLLLTGGTHEERGQLGVTAPVALDGHALDGIDVLQVLDADVSFAVAASNSARFPYVTAPGLLLSRRDGKPYGQIVDGGYFDNNGAVAARAAADALLRARRRLVEAGRMPRERLLHLFLVQVISDPDLPRAELPRCSPEPLPEPAQVRAPTPLDFLLSPIGTLVSVRGERANAGAAELRRLQCAPPAGAMPAEPGIARHFAVFSMGPDREGRLAPLSWVLSEQVRRTILAEDLGGFPEAGNPEELARLGAEWRQAGPRRP
ncbi:patatin-like phospholipase family protein [Roseicella aquatilis]|uniref:Patatin-like phospholipase family protein n=1 Tax=Roseicella aquatilis TaxID=2527868 RepID=A0A4R4DQU3_9PROT|nr:patatin-like phospholipase family protein [Roseicella aquatilis]TCZ64509.1 patatin-like phospholipase family protein [Roseicella aquatilis]